MHDGPAQSLTNIVLQAQIVERLVGRDPDGGPGRGPPARRDGPADPRRDEVVHLRRPADGPRRPRARADAAASARERGRRAGVAVEFDSIGHGPADRRWTSRAASSGSSTRRSTAYLAAVPGPGRRSGSTGRESVSRSTSRRAATRRARWQADRELAEAVERRGRAADKDLPPALEAMLDERREQAQRRPPRPPGCRRRGPAGRRVARDPAAGDDDRDQGGARGDGGELRLRADIRRRRMAPRPGPIGRRGLSR